MEHERDAHLPFNHQAKSGCIHIACSGVIQQACRKFSTGLIRVVFLGFILKFEASCFNNLQQSSNTQVVASLL